MNEKGREEVRYDVVKTETVNYGNNKFLEISRKIAKQSESEEGNEFVSISKGYYAPDGQKRYKGGLGFPSDSKLIDDIVEKLKAVVAQ